MNGPELHGSSVCITKIGNSIIILPSDLNNADELHSMLI